MLLPIHIIIALSSIALSTYLLISPSHSKIKASYTSIALTLLSGTALVITTPSTLVHMCIAGLFYCVGTVLVTRMAAHKLQNTAS